jgi:dipeptidyl aminopeptidase/acylaminoacyl peptidase
MKESRGVARSVSRRVGQGTRPTRIERRREQRGPGASTRRTALRRSHAERGNEAYAHAERGNEAYAHAERGNEAYAHAERGNEAYALRLAGVAWVVFIGLTLIRPASADDLLAELSRYGHKIVYESYVENNWELLEARADGSHPVNLTRTPDRDEFYPHVSPDGRKVCFLAFDEEGGAKVRNVYYMNRDGTGRTLVAKNARWPCWRPDGGAIAYLRNETDELTYADPATTGLYVYDLGTGEHRQHPNKNLRHLYAICWSPDGKWFLATVSGGMGYRHANLAVEADGMGVYDLGLGGCRPDISPDGKKVAWGKGDWSLGVADLDFTGPVPKAINQRVLFTSTKPMMIYHMEWSPDGRYIAFSRGPGTQHLGRHPAIIGVRAAGWNLCVADASATDRWVAITTGDGCNKEPDWVP